MTETFKACTVCGKIKPMEDYFKKNSHESTRRAVCKSCMSEYNKEYKNANRDKINTRHRARRLEHRDEVNAYHRQYKEKHPILAEQARNASLKRKYGIDNSDYERMMQEQGGKCAICGNEKKLHVDHDHQQGKVRGLLCFTCNAAVGLLGDNPLIAKKVIDYLEKHNA